MDISELLFKATTLLGLGMTFVFLFLGLLLIVVKLMAKYIPADPVVSTVHKAKLNEADSSQINPKLVAAISSAVLQYRKNTAA